MSRPLRVLHVDHVLTGEAPPLADVAIVLHEDDTIARVGPASEVIPESRGGAMRVERVRGVVFAGLVNAHTHLELSAMRGRVPGGQGFVPWVDRLVTLRPTLDEETTAAAIDAAVASLVAHATVAVGEVTNGLGAVSALARAGVAGSVFHEVFGWNREQVVARAAQLRRERAARAASWPSSELRYAPAPHTLYTTHPDAVVELLDQARELEAPTSLHLAEHAAERRAVESGEGPLPAWIAGRARVDPASIDWPRRALLDHAEAVGALRRGVLLVHLADARPDELARVAASGASVVLCPRSNLHIEARLPPLLALREAGIEPALGTDSLASAPSLDVLSEAAALLARFPRVPAWQLVRMATVGGARALGRSDLGAIVAGARPGLYVVEGDVDASDPAAWLLAHLDAPRVRLATTRAQKP